MNNILVSTLKNSVTGLFILYTSAYVVVTAWHGGTFPYPTPWWDHWDYWRQYMETDNLFDFIWNTTTEHRLVGTRILILLDIWLSDGSGYLIRPFSYLCQLGTCVFLTLVVARERNITGNAVSVYACMAATVLFFLSQWEAFYLTTLYQVYAVNFFGIGSLYFAFMYSQSENRGSENIYLLFAILFAVSASLNFTTGIIAFPLLLAVLLVQRKNRKHILYVVISFIFVAWTYYLNRKIGGNQGGQLWVTTAIRSTDVGNTPNVLAIISKYFQFYLILIGSAFPVDSLVSTQGVRHLLVAKISGSIGLSAMVGAFIVILFNTIRGRRLHERDLYWLILLLFISMSIGAILFGRAGGGTLTTASASRYRVFSLVLWATLIGFYFPFLARLRYRALATLFYALILIFILWITYEQVRYIRHPVWSLPQFREAALSLKVGSPDYARISRSYPESGIKNKVLKISEWMRREKLHMFSDPRMELMGEAITDHFFIVEKQCGVLDWFKPHTPGVEGLKLGGWAADPVNKRPGKYVLIVGKNNRIIGLGNTGYRHKVEIDGALVRKSGWVAYSKLPEEGWDGITAYLVLPTLPAVNTVCRLKSAWK